MKILSIKDYSGKLRASIQMTGRLGFSEETAKVLQLHDKMSIKFAQDDDTKLYCALPDEEDEDAFKIRKSGRYYYVPLDVLFAAIGIDYKTYNIVFNLVRVADKDTELGGKTYRMDMQPTTIRRKEDKENVED